MIGGKRIRDHRKISARFAGGAILLVVPAIFSAAPAMSQGNAPPSGFNNAPTITLPSICSAGTSPFTLGKLTTSSANLTLVAFCGQNIVTLLGNGDGTFATATPVTTVTKGTNSNGIGFLGFQISLADMNGDGKLDLVTADSDCNVNVFLGNGDGTFASVPNQIPEGPGPPGVFCGFAGEPFLVADLNGDTKPDIILENNFGANNSLTVLLNTTNTSTCSPGLVCFNPTYVQVVTSSSQTVTGLAAGNFYPHSTQAPDIAVSISTPPLKGSSGSTISVFLLENNDLGAFTSHPSQPTFVLPQTPNTSQSSSIAVADFNGDGNVDVAVEDSGDSAIFVLYGDGAGALSSCSPSGSAASIASCQSAAGQTGGQTIAGLPIYPSQAFLAANFNGFPGLLFSNTNNGMTVLLGSATGPLQTSGSNYVAAGENPAAAVSGDLNNDGFPDVILTVLPPRGGALSVFLNNTAGILQGTQAFPAGTAPSEISLLQNFFGNGEQDVAVIQTGVNSGTLTILGAPASGPNGTLPQLFGPEPDPPGGGEITALASGCLLTSSLCTTPFVAYASYEPTGFGANAYIVKGGTSGPSAIITISTGLSSQPVTAMVAGDFNCDGKTDLAFAIGNGGQVLVFTGDGDGTFNSTPLSIFAGLGANPVALAVADFNGDGMPDIAVLNQGNNEVGILMNSANISACPGAPISFATLAGYPTGLTSTVGMTVGDFNNDGKPDIAVASAFSSSQSQSAIAVLLNQGGGVFPNTASATIPLSFMIGPIAAADFNGDGQLDLAVLIGFDFNTMQILTGDGAGNFAITNPPTFAAGLNPIGLVVADFNGDGRPDVAVADGISATGTPLGSGNMVTLLLNGTAAAETPPPNSPAFAQYSISGVPNGGPINFGTVNVGSTGTQALTLTNTGTGSATFVVNSMSLSNINPAFTITSVMCNGNQVSLPFTSSVNLGAGGICTISLQFAPTLNQTGQGELLVIGTTPANVSSNASAGPGGNGQAILLAGDGVEPFASFSNTTPGSPTQVIFGNVVENTPSAQTVTLSNTGDGPLVIQTARVAPGQGFSYSQVVCNSVTEPVPLPSPFTISAGTSCIFTMQFDPTTLGPLGGALGLLDNAAVGESNLTSSVNGPFFTQTISLSGTGVTTSPPPPAMVTDNETISVTDTVTFPDIADSEKITVTDTVLLTVSGGATKTATTTAISSTSTNFDGFSLPTNFALVGTTQVSVNFTAKPSSGNTVPTGTVVVTDGFNDTCSATLTSASAGAGSCALTISQVGSGSTSLTAVYTPDSNASSSGLLASSSSSVTENVAQIVSCGTPPAPATVSEGATTTITFTVCLAGDVNAVPTAVTSNCLSNATCTLTVTAVAGKAGAYTVTLSIATTAGSVLMRNPQPRSGPWPVMLFALSMVLFLWMALLLARHPGGRLRFVYSAGLLLALALAGISGCTSASLTGPSNNNGGTPLGAFTIKVNVKAGNFSVIVPVSVMVTK
jgi:hypothetical protein